MTCQPVQPAESPSARPEFPPHSGCDCVVYFALSGFQNANPRGDVSKWLTSEAFDLKEPMSIEAETAVTKALALLKQANPKKAEIDKVDQLLEASLSDVDRFWARWSEFRKKVEAAR